ncbi:MepB family protein [Embleya sp. NPDC020630]|uniref:MepB family protein n=1 Tax=Embleya sp. NPDC020630 TaxID=3363979 RepID=UPI0037A814F8
MATNPDLSAGSDPGVEPWPADGSPSLPADLTAAKELVYDRIGFGSSRPVAEPESAEYGAYTLTVAGARVRFRSARTTPTKVGLFVTLWRRSAAGPIEPSAVEDAIDLVVIGCRQGEHLGQFVFPTAVLAERGILSVGGVGGKRGFRVYPPWVTPTVRQAERTRAWQVEHFLTLSGAAPADSARIRRLYAAGRAR